MIEKYYRPETLQAALELLGRPHVRTLPLGGGTVLNAPHRAQFDVLDLADLGLSAIEPRGSVLDIGATATLQAVMVKGEIQPALRNAIRFEAAYNLRQAGTVAGTLVAADGRSPFAAAMLALDARLTHQPGPAEVDLGDLFEMRSLGEGFPQLHGILLTGAAIHLKTALAYHYVARTPADRPIVCVAAGRWPSGRLRVVVAGWGRAPRLALDAAETGGVEAAVRSAAVDSGDDWATADYRQDVALKLARRAVREVSSQDTDPAS